MSNLMQSGREGYASQTNPMEIAVAVVLGNPQYEDCSQHGICRVDRLNEHKPCDCPYQVSAILRLSTTGIESLVVQQHNINQEMCEKHFGGLEFRVDTPFYFTPPFLKSVNWPGNTLCIESGLYPLQKTVDRIEILFK